MKITNTVLIKPSSFLCNMNCKYCFYNEEENNRSHKYGKFMDYGTLENIIKKILSDTKCELYLIFQGGEPLLIGIDFYKKLIEIVNKNNVNNVKIFYSLQTNGTLITKEFCNLFKENGFLIGVSLDGNETSNNANRIFKDKSGSFLKIKEDIKLLNNYNVDFNILTVISSEVAKNTEKIYQFYKENNFKFLQFIPLIKENNSLNNNKGELYSFLKTMFDHWYEDMINDKRWSERTFDSILNRIALNDYCDCTMNEKCGLMYSIESNGDVYPCDFYMTDNYLLGNINENSIKEIDNKRNEINFIDKKINDKCKKCKYYAICKGGCKRNTINNKNIYCEDFYKFYEYSYPKYLKLIDLIKAGII